MFFFEGYNIKTVMVLLGLLLLLIILNEITRRSKWAGITMYIIVPILATFFLWPRTAGAGTACGYWFAWVKTYSALAGVIGFMAIRYIKKIGDSKFAFYFPMGECKMNCVSS